MQHPAKKMAEFLDRWESYAPPSERSEFIKDIAELVGHTAKFTMAGAQKLTDDTFEEILARLNDG